MMIKYSSLFLLITLACSCGVSRTSKPAASAFADNIVIAHRGAWKANNLPENSIAALRQAIALGCTGSEFDVRMTADDSLIINHDPSYHELVIEKTTYKELLDFTLSNGEKLPTLQEYLLAGLANNTRTRLVCEIKPSGISQQRAENIAEKVINLVKQLNAERMVTYISFDVNILKRLLQIDPTVSTQYLNGDMQPEVLKAAGIAGIDYAQNIFKMQPGLIASARQHGMILNVWTVNKPEDMDFFITNNFDYITTNEPELLLQKVKNPAGK